MSQYDHEPPRLTPERTNAILRVFRQMYDHGSAQPFLNAVKEAHRDCPECFLESLPTRRWQPMTAAIFGIALAVGLLGIAAALQWANTYGGNY